MNNVDFTNYRFRCSCLGKLMVGVKPRLTAKQVERLSVLREKNAIGKITDPQIIELGTLIDKATAIPTLSETTKTYLKELYGWEVFGKRDDIQSKYLDKGNMVEEHGITLYSEVTGKLFLKNRDRAENDFIVGTCDNRQGKIRDIKCSWDLSTFPMFEDKLPSTDYYWQCMGYMNLWEIESAEVIYCLVDTPDILIDDEKRKALYRIAEMELPADLEAEIDNRMRFGDIPKELRVKVFQFDFDMDAVAMLYDQIIRCREYLNGLSVKLSDKLNEQA